MKKLLFTLLLFAVAAALPAQSNLFIDNSISPEQMVMDFFNTSQVTVSNVTFTGDAESVAFFEAANTDLDLLAGLMLSSGKCTDAANPAAFFASTANGANGDTDLNALSQSAPTYDAAVLEFDLVSQVDTLCFIYRFGSEEYPEYVCTQFNDIFAFFVNGPGYAPNTNIALIPGDTLPVAINNVNGGNPSVNPGCPPSHPEFYVPYDTLMGQHATYDGLTTTLPAKFVVQPGESYHVKIALADVADLIFDSGVFLSINSLGGDSLLTPVAGLSAPAIDGNTVTFTNNSRYGTAWFWNFGDGTTSNERNPGPHTYPQFAPNDIESSGVYEVTLITTNYCCSDTTKMTVTLGNSTGVNDLQAAQFKLSPNPASDWLIVEPLGAQEYSVRIFDAAGRLAQQQTGSGVIKLDVQQLDAGLYTCQVIQGDVVSQQRFVRN